jgi:hypothetical protein
LTSILDGALQRGPFAGEGGQTGASFEQAVLTDGTPVIVKHITTGDWLVVAAGGVSYVERLWRAGVFERMPTEIDHAMIAMEPTEDGFMLLMRDVSEYVLAEGRVLTRGENLRVLEAADAMYREFWEEDLPGCPLVSHLTAFSLGVLPLVEHLDTPIPALMQRGWSMFGDVAPPDVAEVMHVLQNDPAPLARELSKRPVTLIHGDLRLHNMGLTTERVVLLDWELAGTAPPALEFGWYLIISASRIDASREQITEEFRRVLGDRDDPVALELGMIAALFTLGWNKAIDIVENPDPAIRAQERADLDWWIARVRRALETWSPV